MLPRLAVRALSVTYSVTATVVLGSVLTVGVVLFAAFGAAGEVIDRLEKAVT